MRDFWFIDSVFGMVGNSLLVLFNSVVCNDENFF